MLGKNAIVCGALVALAGLAAESVAVVPTYRVDVIAPFDGTTVVEGASDAGHVVGWVSGINIGAYVATVEDGMTMLPLLPGYTSSVALDVNNNGVVVGAATGTGFPFDGGVPTVWVPDGNGGYTMHVPEQFVTIQSPIGPLAVHGGMIEAINDAGVMVGWSRYQGFQGGPTTRFFMDAAPVNLSDLGFTATVRDLNNNNVAVGGDLVFDLNTNTAIGMGVPAPVSTVGFTHVLGYAINDSNEVVAAAHRATSGNDAWLTYLHDGEGAWSALNPAQLASRYVGFYDNNNRGDVSASGGVLFADEGVLSLGYTPLLDPADADWVPALGYIADDRRVYTTAHNTATDEYWIVVLVPDGACAADLTGDGELDIFDVFAYLDLYSASDPAADLTGDGTLDIFDVFAFLDMFNAGCP
ncbi:MAG: hypothetical protein KC996_05885 [Phycisphaerales bacterium]|nr:hypothetical protein [Phycisphaerales bacterium]